MRKLVTVFTLALLALTLVGWGGGVSAQDQQPEQLATPISVDIDGVTVLRLQFGYGPYGPYERLNQIEQRVTHIIDAYMAEGKLKDLAGDVRVDTVNGQTVIMVGSYLLVTVDPAHAKANQTTVEALAAEWANNAVEGFQRFAQENS